MKFRGTGKVPEFILEAMADAESWLIEVVYENVETTERVEQATQAPGERRTPPKVRPRSTEYKR
jgi:hypothetical protein